MLEALLAAVAWYAGNLVGEWRARKPLAAERDRVEHLLQLLARREAPAEQAWYMSDQKPGPPAVPENAQWDESGFFFIEPDEDD